MNVDRINQFFHHYRGINSRGDAQRLRQRDWQRWGPSYTFHKGGKWLPTSAWDVAKDHGSEAVTPANQTEEKNREDMAKM